MVSLMAVVALAPLAGEETDAAVGDGGTYSYTLTYHSDEMANTAAQETQLTVADMTPISHTAGTTTLSAVANEGSWGFNTTTGIGPFNSFYAAFDMTDGNKFVSILNPYDLTKKIDGTSLGTMSNYNIMWVLPTVYWSTDSSGNVTLTNEPGSGTAYAHMIDGKIYQYLAIGVYSGKTETIGSQTVLCSESGVTPTTNLTRPQFRDYANNNVMDASLGTDAKAILWNYDQWTLYRLCSYMVMEGFNSQAIVGNGYVRDTTLGLSHTTGVTNSLGPYAGNPASMGTNGNNSSTYGKDSVRLFIEDPWGNISNYIDGIFVNNNSTIYLDSSSEPSGTTGTYVTVLSDLSLPSTGFSKTISVDERLWGVGMTTQTGVSNLDYGTTDVVEFQNINGTYAPWVAGQVWDTNGVFQYGVSKLTAVRDETYTTNSLGARLAFVYGETITPTITFEISPDGTGTTSVNSISAPIGTTISASTNTITLGTSPDTTTITATPAAATAQYTYTFDSWSGVPAGGTVTEDLTITANFTQTLNEYTITWVIGESSDTSTVAYGATPTHADPTPPDGYYFVGWSPEIVPVTAAATYTAVFSNMTVTFDAGKGTLSGPTTMNVVQGQPIGDLPTPTPKAGYTFIGWFDSEGNEVTSETIVTETESFTLYAQYELDDSLKPVKAMTDLLPLIFVVGIIILMIGTAFYYYRP